MEAEVEEVMKELESLEHFYNECYIDLKQYFELKEKILIKFIAIGEKYKTEAKEGLLNDFYADY